MSYVYLAYAPQVGRMKSHTEIAVDAKLRPIRHLIVLVKAGLLSVEDATQLYEIMKPTRAWSEVMAADHATVVKAVEDEWERMP